MSGPRARLILAIAALGLIALASPACAQAPPGAVVAPAAPDAVRFTLLLIGDAGAPAAREPVLAALRNAAGERAAETLVLFLGDNLYPDGMPPATDDWRTEGERRLAAQVAAVREAGARAIFVPGNHDWRKGPSGLLEQQRFIAERGAGHAELLPVDGCPGPVVRDVTETLRLVLVDTSWWFRDADRPGECAIQDEQAWQSALAASLSAPHPGVTVVAGHHPLESGGRHGGHFAWHEHLFPLRHVHHSLWLPLPLLGSLYPIARKLGIADQDLTSSRYGALRAAMRAAMRDHPPLIYAAGHEHNLQVHPGSAAGYLLISGAGIFGHTSGIFETDGSLYTSEQAGFMRIDQLVDGRLRLAVLTVDAHGDANEDYSLWLEGAAGDDAAR